jgi:hypothetical protein
LGDVSFAGGWSVPDCPHRIIDGFLSLLKMTWPLLRLRQVPKQYLEALIVIIGVWLSRAASLILSRWGLSFGRDFMAKS